MECREHAYENYKRGASVVNTALVTELRKGWFVRLSSRPTYVLTILMLTYAFSCMDRTIFSVLQEPIKNELGLSDTQAGLLGGLVFAVLYCTCSLPLGRLAERADRISIVSVCLGFWSAMTALTGAAAGFWSMALARAGVGIGEAGGVAPAHSLIADMTPPKRRGTALAIHSLGLPVGAAIGAVIGGYIGQQYGWRLAFVAFAIPGLLLALLMRWGMRDPRKDTALLVQANVEIPKLVTICRLFIVSPVLRNLTLGFTLLNFVIYGVNSFLGVFLLRNHGLSLSEMGLILGAVQGICYATGTVGGGLIVDRLASRNVQWYGWLPALGMFLAAPLYMTGYLQPHLEFALIAFCFAQLCQALYVGPVFGLLHNFVGERMRASSIALLFLVGNLVGLGFGPPAVGFVSDIVASMSFVQGSEIASSFWISCPGGIPLDPANSTLALQCRNASALGVKVGLLAALPIMVWAGVHYFLAAVALRGRKDLVRGENHDGSRTDQTASC